MISTSVLPLLGSACRAPCPPRMLHPGAGVSWLDSGGTPLLLYALLIAKAACILFNRKGLYPEAFVCFSVLTNSLPQHKKSLNLPVERDFLLLPKISAALSVSADSQGWKHELSQCPAVVEAGPRRWLCSALDVQTRRLCSDLSIPCWKDRPKCTTDREYNLILRDISQPTIQA